MSAASVPGRPAVGPVGFLVSWLLPIDHRRVAVLYLVAIASLFFLGGLLAGAIRLELLHPDNFFCPNLFNQLLPLHGMILTFLVIVPAIPCVLGNFSVPLMIGARNTIFPVLNVVGWLFYLLGAAATLTALLGDALGGGAQGSHRSFVIFLVAGLSTVALSLLLTGFNLLATVLGGRAADLPWFRVPLFAWSMAATGGVFMLGAPLLVVVLVRFVILALTSPSLGSEPFGNWEAGPGREPVPALLEPLFWDYAHPALFITLLPAFGVVAEVLLGLTGKRQTVSFTLTCGYVVALAAIVIIAGGAFLVGGLHVGSLLGDGTLDGGILGGLRGAARIIELACEAVLLGALVLIAFVALLNGMRFRAPVLHVFGILVLGTLGWGIQLWIELTPTDVFLHDTLVEVAGFHFGLASVTVLAYLAGLHYWWPKITGRGYSQVAAWLTAALLIGGYLVTFLPQFILGYGGMPRRYPTYPAESQPLQMISSGGALLLGVAFVLVLVYMLASVLFGKASGPNPWPAGGLEWQLTSEAP